VAINDRRLTVLAFAEQRGGAFGAIAWELSVIHTAPSSSAVNANGLFQPADSRYECLVRAPSGSR